LGDGDRVVVLIIANSDTCVLVCVAGSENLIIYLPVVMVDGNSLLDFTTIVSLPRLQFRHLSRVRLDANA